MQNIDHNLHQTSLTIAADYLFPQTGCREFATWFSGTGIGVDLTHNPGGQRRHCVSRLAGGGI